VAISPVPEGQRLGAVFRARTENARGTRKTMIVALSRKLLIALWRLVREGVVPDGVVLRPAQ
jgi:transposase